MNKCIKCYNYDKPSCLFKDLNDVDKLKTRTYLVGCWCDDMMLKGANYTVVARWKND